MNIIPENYYNEASVFNMIGSRLFKEEWDRSEESMYEITAYRNAGIPSKQDLAKNIYHHYQHLKKRVGGIEKVQDSVIDDNRSNAIMLKQFRDMHHLNLDPDSIESEEYSTEFERYYRAESTKETISTLIAEDWLNLEVDKGTYRFSKKQVDNVLGELFPANENERARFLIRQWLKPKMLAGKPEFPQLKMFETIKIWFREKHPEPRILTFNMFREVWRDLTATDNEVIASGNAQFWSGKGRRKGSKNKNEENK